MKHVVVGIIYKVINNKNHYLFISSTRDFGEFTGLLYPPGGHIEQNETQEEALTREVEEEIGIKVYPVKKLTQTPGDIKNQITHWWLCEPLQLDVSLSVDDSEIGEVLWLPKNEILSNKDIFWPATYNFFENFFSNSFDHLSKK